MKRNFITPIRLSEFEVELLKQLAKEQEVSSSEYLRSLLRNAAQKSGLLTDTVENSSSQSIAA